MAKQKPDTQLQGDDPFAALDESLDGLKVGIETLTKTIQASFPRGAVPAQAPVTQDKTAKTVADSAKQAKEGDEKFLRSFGLMAGNLQGGLQGIAQALFPIPTSLAGIAKQAVSAGAPGVMDTFTKSIQLAIMPLAKLFIPAILEASAWIQRMVPHIKSFVEAVGKAAGWVGEKFKTFGDNLDFAREKIKRDWATPKDFLEDVGKGIEREQEQIKRGDKDVFGEWTEQGKERLKREREDVARRRASVENEKRLRELDMQLRQAEDTTQPGTPIHFADKKLPPTRLPTQEDLARNARERIQGDIERGFMEQMREAIRQGRQEPKVGADLGGLPGMIQRGIEQRREVFVGPPKPPVAPQPVPAQPPAPGQPPAQAGQQGGQPFMDAFNPPGYQARFQGVGDVTRSMQTALLDQTSLDAAILKQLQELYVFMEQYANDMRNREANRLPPK